MLFAITGCIIVFTLLGILAVCAFRLCEDSREEKEDHDKIYDRTARTNHYEPLKRQLKEVEDGMKNSRDSAAGSKQPEAKVDTGVSDENKPLNTQQNDLREVRVAENSNKPKFRQPAAEIHSSEFQNQVPQSNPTGNPQQNRETTKTDSFSPAVKVGFYAATTAAAVAVASAARKSSSKASENAIVEAGAPAKADSVSSGSTSSVTPAQQVDNIIDLEDERKLLEEPPMPNGPESQKSFDNDVPVSYVEIENATSTSPVFDKTDETQNSFES